MFYGRLALALGKTLRQLLDEVDAQELAFWMAFERVEGPFGYARNDRQAAWAGWIQTDMAKVKPIDALAHLSSFVVDAMKSSEPETEEEKAARNDQLFRKLVAFAPLPEGSSPWQ